MNRLKTYIVEDSALIRENLIATLQELAPIELLGYAEDEAQAVGWLASVAVLHTPLDLVIVDIFLKEGSGLGVLRAPRAAGATHKRVVLSNFASREMRRKCLALGADRVFDKSHDIDEFIAYCAGLH
ncbi:MAG: response regulator [Rubrivivax sp.]|jgi:DNA-binding NarL/FixJ family response regulator|nr:response regulator [Rubrivivax sp.]